MKAKLLELIEDSFGTDVNTWLSKSELVNSVVRPGERGADIERVRDIYQRRARRNRIRNYPIEGFETLLENLSRTTAKAILIHDLADQFGVRHLIFTDTEVKELLGILRFPK